jgi:putative intracellular protease/amidase
MRLSILIYDGVTTLDAIGGYEVLARIPGIETEFVAPTRGVIAADTRRLGLLAYRSFDEVRSTDILYVPGGPGGRRLETDQKFLDYLRVLDRTSTWTIGICNGVTLLAAAGLLEGCKATTNWFDRERIAQYGVEFVPERYHVTGKYVTGAGVSASIDTAFFFAKQIAGEDLANAIQLGLEYYPQPPLTAKTPEETPAHIHKIVRDHAAAEATILQMRPAFADAMTAA